MWELSNVTRWVDREASYVRWREAIHSVTTRLVVQVPFRAITGLETQLATLAMVALFNPLRRYIQNFIVSCFYRRKNDAAKTLEGFSMKLRDETDLDALSDELVGYAGCDMHPPLIGDMICSLVTGRRSPPFFLRLTKAMCKEQDDGRTDTINGRVTPTA